MKFSTLFLLTAVILAFGDDWSIPACVIVICASVWMLVDDVIPGIRRYLHESKTDKED